MPPSFNQEIIEEFRANGGKVGGPFEGGDLLLMTTTGARSGREHTVPLGYVRYGKKLLVVASAAGAPRHPAWYHNLLAHPMVRVEVGTESFGAIAVPAEGGERDRLFEEVLRVAPGYAEYRDHTTRVLPVVALERSEPVPEEGDGVRAVDDSGTTLADKLLEIHTWLRSQLRHAHHEVEAHLAARKASGAGAPPPPPGLGLQIRQHCLAFCQSLDFHHSSENTHLLPALAEQHPHLRGTVERLREEHRVVARLQGELVTLLDDVTTAAPDHFRRELNRLSDELTAHLEYEESTLLPVLATIPFPPADAPPSAPSP
ncbi:nitroreductase/quinone reductase family protein [Streptomyces sp. ST2-7A]|uniref:nitroreductase/quinone reductase family protein n=1 Tax=Streptomyces sp. ST2-7A TaxID=2907214 RepID=UPI001F4297FB|nr:nitroreductase/quinone reductase family protein [Streptomyces sp. ST2-7A]MCE7081957.1 nitroreductase/quinone reductase family protein [Streptomyces sp. ST2-7A]